VAAHDPAIVVVLLGGNDMLQRRPRADAQRDLREIVRRIVAAGAVPVLIGIELGLFGPGYGAFVAEVADETGAVYLDGIVDDVLRDPGLKVDSIHPNARGHRRIAELLQEPIGELAAEILARRRS
jgi:lysophospholipase L1-like esterase